MGSPRFRTADTDSLMPDKIPPPPVSERHRSRQRSAARALFTGGRRLKDEAAPVAAALGHVDGLRRDVLRQDVQKANLCLLARRETAGRRFIARSLQHCRLRLGFLTVRVANI